MINPRIGDLEFSSVTLEARLGADEQDFLLPREATENSELRADQLLIEFLLNEVSNTHGADENQLQFLPDIVFLEPE